MVTRRTRFHPGQSPYTARTGQTPGADRSHAKQSQGPPWHGVPGSKWIWPPVAMLVHKLYRLVHAHGGLAQGSGTRPTELPGPGITVERLLALRSRSAPALLRDLASRGCDRICFPLHLRREACSSSRQTASSLGAPRNTVGAPAIRQQSAENAHTPYSPRRVTLPLNDHLSHNAPTPDIAAWGRLAANKSSTHTACSLGGLKLALQTPSQRHPCKRNRRLGLQLQLAGRSLP